MTTHGGRSYAQRIYDDHEKQTAELELENDRLKREQGCQADCQDLDTKDVCAFYDTCEAPQRLLDRIQELANNRSSNQPKRRGNDTEISSVLSR